MTDHNREEREALIEKAAHAIIDAKHPGIGWGTLSEEARERRRKQARAALAVFEQAHTPTSDERGRSRGKYTDAQVLYMILLALEEGLEGVKWQDLDDLLIKMIAEHWGTADEDTSPDEAEAAFAQLEPYIPDDMRAAKPQTEPSDKRECGFMGCGSPRCADLCVPEPQVEPTDAQVIAALREFVGLYPERDNYFTESQVQRMRAALRAAAAVREEGRGR